MNSPRDKWNRIYSGESAPGSIAAVLEQNADLLPKQGRALDIACGTGANALFLAERGMEVDARDISDVVIASLANQHPRLHPRAVDVTPESLFGLQFDLILTCHYLDPALAPAILEATSPAGLIIYQTFTSTKKVDIGPSNPDFLLKPGDLEKFVDGCDILAKQDGSDILEKENTMAGRAWIIARKLVV
ncbi:MAG: methyltransferase domain-containing protein [Pseudomonadales bacterium]|jgi:tellurite methyltransferase|nr:methyltransferase domain-containing protein [Pseudomonadales bacterium]